MTLIQLQNTLATHGICLTITPKSVKNINFRVGAGYVAVSVPKTLGVNDTQVANAICQRLDWIINTHQKLLTKQANKASHLNNHLWGEPYAFANENEKRQIYRQELAKEIHAIYPHWQQIVGKSANKITLKSLKSRWGSCNTRTHNINLAIELAAFPKPCTAYVLVHELCHLHYANHSKDFWACVKKAMPDYQAWHDLLRGKGDL